MHLITCRSFFRCLGDVIRKYLQICCWNSLQRWISGYHHLWILHNHEIPHTLNVQRWRKAIKHRLWPIWTLYRGFEKSIGTFSRPFLRWRMCVAHSVLKSYVTNYFFCILTTLHFTALRVNWAKLENTLKVSYADSC
jgi:hypothetical protein